MGLAAPRLAVEDQALRVAHENAGGGGEGAPPVLSEQPGLGRAEPVAAFALAQVEAVLGQPAVERAGVVERRDGDE